MAGELIGLKEAVKALASLDKKARKKALRKMVSDPSKVVLRSAKAQVSRGATGLLKKSLGRKVKVYGSGNAFAIVGARDGFRTEVGTYSRGPKKGEPRYANPTKYLHLVERGTSHSAAKPFIEPAFSANVSAIQEMMAEIAAAALSGRA